MKRIGLIEKGKPADKPQTDGGNAGKNGGKNADGGNAGSGQKPQE